MRTYNSEIYVVIFCLEFFNDLKIFFRVAGEYAPMCRIEFPRAALATLSATTKYKLGTTFDVGGNIDNDVAYHAEL
jgi:hypothetical protein